MFRKQTLYRVQLCRDELFEQTYEMVVSAYSKRQAAAIAKQKITHLGYWIEEELIPMSLMEKARRLIVKNVVKVTN